MRYHSLKALKEVFPYSNAQSSRCNRALQELRHIVIKTIRYSLYSHRQPQLDDDGTNQHTFKRIQKIKVTTTSFTLYCTSVVEKRYDQRIANSVTKVCTLMGELV